MVRGVARTIHQALVYTGHVRAKTSKGIHWPPSGGGAVEGIGVAQLVGVVEHEHGQHVGPQGQDARESRLHRPQKAVRR